MIGFFFAAQWGCKKDPEKFTIKGRIVDGTTDFRYKNITFDVFGADRNENASDNLGSFTTNDSGDFEFIYEKAKGSFSISLLNSFIRFKRLPVNQNIDKVFYKSTLGKVKVFLKTTKLLQNNKDTLYLYEYFDNKVHIDTFTTLPDEYFFYRTPPPGGIGFGYGRNNAEFFYDYKNKSLIRAKEASTEVTGDPIVDELVINY